MYKLAIRRGITFPSPKGELNLTQLFKLNLPTLAGMIKETHKQIKQEDVAEELAFLETNTVKQQELTDDVVRFEVLKDVFNTIKEEQEANRLAFENKAHNQKILALIERKKEASLENLSVEELQELLRQ